MLTTDDDTRANYAGCYAETFDCDPDPWTDGDDFDPLAPQWDNRPHVPQIDDCPDAYRIGREQRSLSRLGYSLSANQWYGPDAWTRLLTWAGYDFAGDRAAGRVWSALCDRCETHAEAARRYLRWATRHVTRRRTA